MSVMHGAGCNSDHRLLRAKMLVRRSILGDQLYNLGRNNNKYFRFIHPSWRKTECGPD